MFRLRLVRKKIHNTVNVLPPKTGLSLKSLIWGNQSHKTPNYQARSISQLPLSEGPRTARGATRPSELGGEARKAIGQKRRTWPSRSYLLMSRRSPCGDRVNANSSILQRRAQRAHHSTGKDLTCTCKGVVRPHTKPERRRTPPRGVCRSNTRETTHREIKGEIPRYWERIHRSLIRRRDGIFT